jgi:hypothetical protein
MPLPPAPLAQMWGAILDCLVAIVGPCWAGPSWGHLGAILGHLGVIVGSSWGHLEAIMGHLGLYWGHLGAISGPSWAILGPSLGHLGAILGPSRAIERPSWAVLMPFSAILGHLDAISGAFWGYVDLCLANVEKRLGCWVGCVKNNFPWNDHGFSKVQKVQMEGSWAFHRGLKGESVGGLLEVCRTFW